MADVAIIGRAGAGKSTLARALQYRLGYQRLSIAAPIKRLVHEAYPGIGKLDVVPGLKSADGTHDLTGRELLQLVGAAGRSIDPDMWLRMWARSRDALGPRLVVTDDLRLTREVHWVRSQRPGTLVVMLTADPAVLARRAGEVAADVTEQLHGADHDLLLDTSTLEPEAVYAAVITALKVRGNA